VFALRAELSVALVGRQIFEHRFARRLGALCFEGGDLPGLFLDLFPELGSVLLKLLQPSASERLWAANCAAKR